MSQPIPKDAPLDPEIAKTAKEALRVSDAKKTIDILNFFYRLFGSDKTLTLQDLEKKIQDALKDKNPTAT